MNAVELNQIVPKIGRILRLYREKTGRNQADIAERAGISVSMLSQIERGMVSPSIDTLICVCGVLDLDLSELFRKIETDRPVRIMHPGERLKNELSGVRYEQLMTSQHPAYQAELSLIELEVGAATSFSGGSNGHEGIEMGYVLEGCAMLEVDGEKHRICAGESIFFSSRRSHRIGNCGKGLFRAVWSISPPHVDYFGNSEPSDSSEVNVG